MKILIYSANFSPEQTGIGKYSGEMADWLASSGHEVRVITGMPHYPEWKINEAYIGKGYFREVLESGAEVLRAPHWVPGRLSGTSRALYLIGFAVTSLPCIVFSIFWKPDIVLTVAPALVCAPGGWALARLTGAAAWLHVQDFEVDVAFRLGLLRGRFQRNIVEAAERWLFRRFDRVSSISRRMVERARDKGVPSGRALFFPNWVDLTKIRPSLEISRFRTELQIPEDAIVALYSGSLGAKHGLDLLPVVARRLSHLPNFYLVVCGDGVFQPMLVEAARTLANMRTLPLQPSESLSELLGMADIHLLPQSPDVSDLVMPSKVSGMFASSRPVVAASAPGTELAMVIAGNGIVVAPADDEAFCAAVERLVFDPQLRHRQGAHARRYAELHLGKEAVLTKLMTEMMILRDDHRSARSKPQAL